MVKRKQPKCRHMKLVNGKQFILLDNGRGKVLQDEHGDKFLTALVCLDCYGVWL